jgi:hypothetical protein
VALRRAEREADQTPYVPATGKKRHALVNIPLTWGTFEQAKNTGKTGGFDRIGFVLGQGIFGIDSIM